MTDNQAPTTPGGEHLRTNISRISQYGESEHYLAFARTSSAEKQIPKDRSSLQLGSGALSRIYSACERDYTGVIARPALRPSPAQERRSLRSKSRLNKQEKVRSRAIAETASKTQFVLVDSYERRDAWVEFIDSLKPRDGTRS